VLEQLLAGLAGLLVQRRETAFELPDDVVERGLRDMRIVPVGVQDLLLTLEVLEQIGLQVGARRDVDDLEHRGQRVMMVERLFARHQDAQATQQVLEPEVGAYAFVERKFVQHR